MKIAVVAAAGAIALAAEAHADSQPLDYVRATTGTINSFALSAGNVYPAICRPWGGPMWAPVTKPGHSEGWFYDYTGTQFYGMRLTHQPSPWMNDFGQVTVVPVSGPVDEKMESRRSHFSHKSETIRPDYYRVYLGDSDIGFELTAAKRSCVMRITYGDAEKPGFVVDAMGDDGKVEVDREKRRVYGVSARRATPVADDFGNRFVVEFDREIVSVEGGGSWCCVRFAPARRGDVLTARMASSFVDREYAVANLAEVSGRSFDAVRAESAKVWNSVLGRFKAETPDIDRKRMFYTALYRASLFPRAYYDIDARTKKAVHRSPTPGGVFEGPFYVGTGFWDTFRALFPLLNFAYPEVNALMTEGLENSWKEAGWFPEWSSPGLSDCMTGNNSASVCRCRDAVAGTCPRREQPASEAGRDRSLGRRGLQHARLRRARQRAARNGRAHARVRLRRLVHLAVRQGDRQERRRDGAVQEELRQLAERHRPEAPSRQRTLARREVPRRLQPDQVGRRRFRRRQFAALDVERRP